MPTAKPKSKRWRTANTSGGSSRTSKPTRRRMGLNEEIVRFISKKKNEPEWMLDWRLKAYRHWLTMEEPHAGR